ncbi:hypothetical protein [Mesorhizobium sp. Root157]|uniref:hypothetical protein n=1 Tax=Mesorhizobium sp. Root157 TaxID=1736477 RepID=UPI0009E94E85|nr:hypothetical protein [Mesorhizobium sp. Root157]
MPDHPEYETGARKLQGMPESDSPSNDATPEKDAEGQSEKRHHGGVNDGTSSANPRVISGNDDGDATFPFKKPTDEDLGEANDGNVTPEGLSPPTSDEDNHPADRFPPFDDPAYSSKPATPAISEPRVDTDRPEDPIFAGHPEFSKDAAKNKLPPGKMGNATSLDDVNEKTRHSDGQNSSVPTPNPDIQKVAGSGPAIAEHSKDAITPVAGRQPGAYVKDDPLISAADEQAGTTDQKPRWEGPPENRPRGYLPAVDDPETDRDAAGENLRDA